MTVLRQRHPDGVVTVTFRQPEEADVCIAAVDRRWFDGRSLVAESWDGRTKFTIKETQEEMEKRLNKWHSFIEGGSTKTDGDSKSEGQSTETPPDTVPDTTVSSSKSEDVAENTTVTDVNKSSDDAQVV